MNIYPDSALTYNDFSCALARADGGEKLLLLRGETRGFEGLAATPDGAWTAPLTSANAAALRARLPWLNPVPLGLRTSAGLGDRLGLATPGHVRAVRETGLAPIFAQQSVRENARTGRTPQQVIDEAAWGVFQTGWQQPWGADADHIKQPADLPAFLAAGYSFYTVDPGEYVRLEAESESLAALRARFDPAALRELLQNYRGRSYNLESASLSFDEESLLRAAVKYGEALAHTTRLYRQIEAGLGANAFDFELSVDETDSPTTPLEHVYIATELIRAGVRCASLAPRFVGRFEKGVDYIGDPGLLEEQIGLHAAVTRSFGGYKLSLHSGSDKFSVYPVAARLTRGRVHLKTAGTSYLEALRVAAEADPAFFRQLFTLSLERYASDRASYHVSALPERIPALESLFDVALPDLLDLFDARQVLHVAFGAVLAQHGPALKSLLTAHEEAYYAGLQAHFARHLQPFASADHAPPPPATPYRALRIGPNIQKE
jgi:hypothetical protein